MQISEHIYMMLGPMYANLANVYVIRADESLILIDTAENENDIKIIEKNIQRFGLDHLPIRHVLLTHKHFGHIGNAAYYRSNGATIYAGCRDADAIASASLNEVMDFSPFPERNCIPCDVDVRLNDGEVLDIDGIRITVYEVPGHTPGSVLYAVEDEGKKILFTGDVIGVTDCCMDTTIGWEGAPDFDMEENFRSLLKMAEMECDIILPGHMQTCMQEGHLLLKKAVNTALLKWRKPSIERE